MEDCTALTSLGAVLGLVCSSLKSRTVGANRRWGELEVQEEEEWTPPVVGVVVVDLDGAAAAAAVVRLSIE